MDVCEGVPGLFPATGVTGNAWHTGCYARSGRVTTERSAVVTRPEPVTK